MTAWRHRQRSRSGRTVHQGFGTKQVASPRQCASYGRGRCERTRILPSPSLCLSWGWSLLGNRFRREWVGCHQRVLPCEGGGILAACLAVVADYDRPFWHIRPAEGIAYLRLTPSARVIPEAMRLNLAMPCQGADHGLRGVGVQPGYSLLNLGLCDCHSPSPSCAARSAASSASAWVSSSHEHGGSLLTTVSKRLNVCGLTATYEMPPTWKDPCDSIRLTAAS